MRHSEIIALGSLAAIGVGALLFGKFVASSLERTIADEARQKLAVIGFSDIEVEADGLVLALSGRVRSERDHQNLKDTFGAMAGVSGVIDRIAVITPPIDLKPSVLVVQKDGDAITLSGEAPDASTRDILISKARVASDGAQLLNLLKAQDRGEPPAHWLSAAEAAIDAVAALRAGRATVERDLLRIEGAAPNADAKAAIEATLTSGVGELITLELDISSPPPFLSPYVFRAEKRRGELRITECAAPEPKRASVILGALKASGQGADLQGVNLEDEASPCGIATGAPNEFWADAAARALETLAALEAGEVAMIDDRIRVVGFLKKGADVEQARLRAARGWPEGYALDLDISEEFPVVSPFALSIDKRPGEVTLAGYAPSIERAEAWATRLGAVNDLSLARGAPPEFAAAVGVIVEGLAELKVGSAELRDTRFTLAAPGDETERLALEERLSRALPAGYRLTVTEAKTPSALLGDATAVASGVAAALDKFVFTARRTASGSSQVIGVVGDTGVQRVVQAMARARLGGDQMSMEIGLRDATQPAGWQRALFAGLGALAELDEGEVTIERNALYLRGTVDAAEKARYALEALESSTPSEYTRFSRITVAEPDPTAGLADNSPFEPTACAAALNALVVENPIVFDTGAAAISGDSYDQIEALAKTLRRCPTARIQIGGHTDDEGSAELNQALSARRAEAVRRNLAVRSVDPERLVAIGFGETAPIADNATEEGRARNRRIEFKLLE